MALLESLGNKLVSASVGTLATNLFLGYMPESPDTCIALFEYSGLPPVETMRDMNETLDLPNVQVMVRASKGDYPTARNKIVDVQTTLTAITDETINGLRFLRVSNQSAINSLGRDVNERPLFSLSLTAVVER